MRRRMIGFHQDDEGDWVAELDCLHGQHVRHRPPFFDRPWVEDEEGRRGRIGAELDCPLCDRAELPAGLVLARTAGPFDEDSLPEGLRRTHRVAASTWGTLRVIEGRVAIEIDTDPPLRADLSAGGRQPIPPEVGHRLVLDGPAVLAVDFWVREVSPAGA